MKERKFLNLKPMNRGSSNVSSKAKKPTVSPTQQIEPIKPVTLGITTNVPLPINNNEFSIFSNVSSKANQLTVKEANIATNVSSKANQETTDNDDKTDYFNKPNARLQYINEEQRQAHLNSVKKFASGKWLSIIPTESLGS